MLSWRKLGVLIRHLPSQSATMTALRAAQPDLAEEASEKADPQAAPWSQTDMLLAALTDAVRHLSWMYAAVHAKKAPPAPEPIPRPGVKAKVRKVMTVEEYERLTGERPPLHLLQGGSGG